MKLDLDMGLKLKKKYGTPLYCYDVNEIKGNMLVYKSMFKSDLFDTDVIYASKAFCVKDMLRLVKGCDLSLDVVSMGELYTAKCVDFDMNRIYFHGNNKLFSELEYAVDLGVGNIVLDNYMELEVLADICRNKNKCVNVLIRLNVGVEAHTHKYIVTSHIDSKFGVLYGCDEYNMMIDYINKCEFINLIGFHCHIGSQIFDLVAFNEAIDRMVNVCKDFDYPLVLNVGGGFGVKYIDSDSPVSLDLVSKFLIKSCEDSLVKNNVKIKKLCIEPGRSIVGEAGVTLYSVGYVKKTPNKLYYFVDGGMTDNIRPCLYDAVYNADILGKEDMMKNHVVTVAGKCCESGDVIIENCLLPEASYGDLLVTYTTGAYGYSMSSNYNKILSLPVVFIEDGVDRLVVKRQSLEELVMREL